MAKGKKTSSSSSASNRPDLALRIFQTAGNFGKASTLLLTNGMRGDPHLLFPGTVYQAFELELYLKCLIRVENNVPPRHHKLDELFALVRSDSQMAIKNYHATKYNNDPRLVATRAYVKSEGINSSDDFDTMLQESRDAFETVRYMFEGNLCSFTAGIIIPAVKDRILDLRPEWRDKQLQPVNFQRPLIVKPGPMIRPAVHGLVKPVKYPKLRG